MVSLVCDGWLEFRWRIIGVVLSQCAMKKCVLVGGKKTDQCHGQLGHGLTGADVVDNRLHVLVSMKFRTWNGMVGAMEHKPPAP